MSSAVCCMLGGGVEGVIAPPPGALCGPASPEWVSPPGVGMKGSPMLGLDV